MATEPLDSQAENDYENEYYGTPTHTCRHCDRVFPARWTGGHSQLKIELLSIREAKQAANDGCSFYLWNTCKLSLELIDNPLPEPIDESTQLHLILEPRSEESGRYLEGQALIEGHEEQYCGDWYTAYEEDSCNSLAEDSKGHLWFDGPFNPTNLNPVSTRAKTLMHSWVRQCCSPLRELRNITTNGHPGLPKRLLKLESSGKSVRLITTSQYPVNSYAVLSYCWGGDQAAKTVRSNLLAHEAGVPTRNLSASIRDALRVTAILELEYLWVDALCIVQDDADDIASEISRMAQIYKNGTVTILAGGAASARDGFLQRRQKWDSLYRITVQMPSPDLRKTALLMGSQNTSNDDEPVTSRAWIFQEIVLSPRILYFSPYQLLFYHCRDSVYIDGGPQYYHLPCRHLQFGQIPSSEPLHHDTNYPQEELSNMWGAIIRAYTDLSLTVSSDKLLAISAVAETIGAMFLTPPLLHESYKAGLWVQHFPSNLLWSPSLTDYVRPAFRAPTWSWVAVDGAIDYPSELIHPDRVVAKLVSWTVQLTASIAPFGQVTGGQLTLEAPLLSHVEHKMDETTISLHPAGFSSFSGDLDALEPDFSDQRPDAGYTVSLLCIAGLPETLKQSPPTADQDGEYPQEWRIAGLVLAQEPGSDVYSRIGYFRHLERRLGLPGEVEGPILHKLLEQFTMTRVTII